MNAGILPSLLLCASIALMLSFTKDPTTMLAIGAMTATAAVAALIAQPPALATAIFVGVFATIIAAGVLTYFPSAVAQRLATPLAAVAGVGVGTMASASGRKSDLLLALPLVLLFIPGRWIVARGLELGLKIVASWLIAIALLATFVSMTPTPGYEPDHKE